MGSLLDERSPEACGRKDTDQCYVRCVQESESRLVRRVTLLKHR